MRLRTAATACLINLNLTNLYSSGIPVKTGGHCLFVFPMNDRDIIFRVV